MATISDNFNRANSTSTLGTTSDGQAAWSAINASTWGISSNQGYVVTNGSGAIAIATLPCRSADGTISVDLTVATGAQGIAFRVQDANNYWAAATDGLYKVSGGSFTQVAALSLSGSTGTMSVILSGSSITVQWNGVTQTSTTDSFLSTQTSHGIGIFSSVTQARFDNFSGPFVILPKPPPSVIVPSAAVHRAAIW